ncbi:MAG: thioredoxin [Hyphomicrobiales bacterium]|jgi:putative thioredoxin
MLIGTGSTPQSTAPAAAGGDIIDITTADFMAQVIEESKTRPVVVDFWAPWCGPCKQLTPTLENAVAKAGGKVRLAKMNIDEHPEVAGQMGVQSIPAVFAFVDGRPADGFQGAQPEAQVKAFIEKLIGPQGPSQAEEMLAAADAALSAGDLQTAANMYAQILQVEPENVGAMAGMLKVYVAAGELETARQALASLTDEMKADPAIQAAEAALHLAEKAASLGDAEELTARLEANPDDHQARFDLALVHNAKNHRSAAATALVEIIQRDRSWEDDGARKELLRLFEAWGPTDPASIEGRKKLSRVLFS